MKSLIATTLMLSLLGLPAGAHERPLSRRGVSQRIERLQRERRTGEHLGDRIGERSGSRFEIRGSDDDGTPRRTYDPIDLEYRRESDRIIHRGSSRRAPIRIDSGRRSSTHRSPRSSPRTVFGLSGERGVVIFEPDRTFIIRQRDRFQDGDVIHLNQERLNQERLGIDLPMTGAATPVVTPPSQQEDPRLLHDERISPFAARVYAKEPLAGHEGPSTVYPTITRFSPGQTVTALQSAGGADGIQWYLITADRQMAWVRGDRLLVNSQ